MALCAGDETSGDAGGVSVSMLFWEGTMRRGVPIGGGMLDEELAWGSLGGWTWQRMQLGPFRHPRSGSVVSNINWQRGRAAMSGGMGWLKAHLWAFSGVAFLYDVKEGLEWVDCGGVICVSLWRWELQLCIEGGMCGGQIICCPAWGGREVWLGGGRGGDLVDCWFAIVEIACGERGREGNEEGNDVCGGVSKVLSQVWLGGGCLSVWFELNCVWGRGGEGAHGGVHWGACRNSACGLCCWGCGRWLLGAVDGRRIARGRVGW